MENKFSFLKEYNGRKDLETKYESNALLLYALQLRFDIEDIDSVAADALTDAPGDKKCDLIFVDRELGLAVVAQGYCKPNPKSTDTAKGNKASDLNTAGAWVFSNDLSKVPKPIVNAVSDLQDAINKQLITSVSFWCVHNLDESNNSAIKEELLNTQEHLQAVTDSKYGSGKLKISTLEVGLNTIQKWFDSYKRRILITDDIKVNCKKGFEIESDSWRAVVTAVSGKWLRELYLKKGDELFSGNPRNYLGSGKGKKDINRGIIKTVESEPENFWTYNNGVTALVNDYKYSRGKLTIKGITIINGAQTTGAIAASERIDSDFYIPCRFIVCSDKKIIESIINNNNKQNEILPSDLRSNDKQQERLRREFEQYPMLLYNGGRRDSTIVKNKIVLDPYLVAQTVLAFQGDCVIAYNGKKRIWDEDKLYTQVFMDELSVEHIIFVYSLSKAIDETKNKLRKKDDKTDLDNEKMNFLSKRGSKMLLIATISACLEDILGVKISDKFRLKFKDSSNFSELIKRWEKIINSILQARENLEPALVGGLNNQELANKQIKQVKEWAASTQEKLYDSLKTVLNKIER